VRRLRWKQSAIGRGRLISTGCLQRCTLTVFVCTAFRRLLANVLKNNLEIEDVAFGKMALGRVGRQPVALVDLDVETAQAVLDAVKAVETAPDASEGILTALPPGMNIGACVKLPDLVDDQSSRGPRRSSPENARGGSSRGGYGQSTQARGGYGQGREERGDGGGGAPGRSWTGAGSGGRGRTGSSMERVYRPGGMGR
jgi:hypothetical protein